MTDPKVSLLDVINSQMTAAASVKPITPDEAHARFVSEIPGYVIEAVNDLLAEEASTPSPYITLLQDAVMRRIISTARDKGIIITKEYVIAKRMLDFEPIFRKHGWDVTHDNPAYNESYAPSYKFRRKAQGYDGR